MLDAFRRDINYLRISVTDRCNMRCTYCMPEGGMKLFKHEEILSFEEIYEFVKVAVKFGVDKIRFTGGEPLVRNDFPELVKMISSINGIKDMSMTTNGLLLYDYADVLKEYGLKRPNISLDSMIPENFKKITRGGDINKVLKGIEKAKQLGFDPIKINCVIKENQFEEDAQTVAKFCIENNLHIRYIKQMDLKKGEFWVVEGGSGGDCSNCNRLRLTSNGKLKPCLFNDTEYDIRILGAEEAIKKAVLSKPEKGNANNSSSFSNVGG